MLFAATIDNTLADSLSGRATVVDGDTLKIGKERIRLFGIDAPEKTQICQGPDGHPWKAGQASGAWLADLIGRRPVTCEWTHRDRYGRALATCHQETIDINAAMVRSGWAFAFGKYSDRYTKIEAAARAAHAGVWQGQCELPGDWRKRRR